MEEHRGRAREIVGQELARALDESRVDYRVDAKLVGTIAWQQGAESDELRGLLIPVRIVGPFEAPEIDVQLEEFLKANLAKLRAEEKAKLKAEIEKQKAELKRQIEAEKAELEAAKKRELEKQKQLIEAEKKAAKQKLKDKLKNLF